MNYEQFFYWIQGIAESNSDKYLSTLILRKSKEVHAGFSRKTDPILPDLPPLSDDMDELSSFLDADSIPIETEDLPTVGSEMKDASDGNWTKADEELPS